MIVQVWPGSTRNQADLSPVPDARSLSIDRRMKSINPPDSSQLPWPLRHLVTVWDDIASKVAQEQSYVGYCSMLSSLMHSGM